MKKTVTQNMHIVHTFFLDFLSIQKLLTDWYFEDYLFISMVNDDKSIAYLFLIFEQRTFVTFSESSYYSKIFQNSDFKQKRTWNYTKILQDGENPNFSKQTVALHTYFTLLLIFQLSYIQYAKCYNDKTCKEKYFPL